MISNFLYKFVQESEQWTFTSGSEPITHNGEVYEPAVIAHGDVTSRPEISRASLDLEIESGHPLAESLRLHPTRVCSFTLFRQVSGVSSIYWRGKLVGLRPEGAKLGLVCDNLFVALRRPGLRRICSRSCPYPVYSEQCKVGWPNGPAIPSAAGTVGGISPGLNILVIYDSAHPASGWFNGGIIQTNLEKRMVVRHWYVATTADNKHMDAITLDEPFSELSLDQAVTVLPGCGKTLEICRTKFGNHLNFGGLPWLRSANPFSGQDSL